MKNRLSTIVVAFNTHDLTVKHVQECMNSSYMPDEIIVVNDGGTTDLREKLLELDIKTRLVYVRVEEDILWNYNGAYNLGFWCSRGDILALEDSDHIPCKDAYTNALKLFENEKLGRVAFGRIVVELKDVLENSSDKWVHGHHIGGHENSTMLRREVFMNMKGNDEMMCGRYGWIGYDWAKRRDRSLNQLGLDTVKTGSYFMVQGGACPNMERPMSKENYQVFHRNSAFNRVQHEEKGILNFTFTNEVLTNESKKMETIDPKKFYTKEYYDRVELFSKRAGRLKSIIGRMNIPKSSKVLDVGCGHGFLVNRLRRNKIDAIGTDPSEFAGKFIPEYFTRADSKKLPFKDKEFDVVISTDVFEHIPEEDIDEVYAEMQRVGKRVMAIICPKRGTEESHITIKSMEEWSRRLKGVEILN